MHCSVDAKMRILQKIGIAASTFITMIEILYTTSPTYATSIAVKLVL